MAGLYKVRAIPEIFIIDQNGIIYDIVSARVLEKKINELLPQAGKVTIEAYRGRAEIQPGEDKTQKDIIDPGIARYLVSAQEEMDPAKKITILNEAIEKYPVQAQFYIKRGSVYIHDVGDYGLALKDFSKAIELDPNNLATYIYRMQAYSSTGENDLALKDFKKIIESPESPQPPAKYKELGEILLERGAYEMALESFNKCLEINKDSSVPEFAGSLDESEKASIYASTGRVHYQLEDYEKAAEDFTGAIEIKPGDAEYYKLRAQAYSTLEKHDLFIADSEKIIELDPDSADSYVTRGNIHLYKKEYEAVLADYEQALKISPAYIEKLAPTMIEIYYYMNDYEKAIACCRKTLEAAPENGLIHEMLIACLSKTKRYDEKLAEINNCIVMFPDNPIFYNLRAWTLFITSQDLQSALDDINKAISLKEDIEAFWDTKANILRELGQYEEALKSIDRAIELGAQVPLFYITRASIYCRTGNQDMMKRDLEKAKEINPEIFSDEEISIVLEKVPEMKKFIAVPIF